MRRLGLAIVVLAAAGCSVPPTTLGMDAKDVRGALAALKSAEIKGDASEVARQSTKLEKLADGLAAITFIGDPRHALALEALAKVRDMRAEVEAKKALQLASEFDLAVARADAALRRAGTAKDAAKPPLSDLDLSALGSRPEANADGSKQKAPAGSADADLDRGTGRGYGDKEGDIPDEVEVAKRAAVKKAEDDGLPAGGFVVDADTKSVTLLPPVSKDKGAVVYFYFYNKGPIARVCAVFGEFKGERTRTRVLGGFELDGFEVNWQDILASKGKSLNMDGVPVQQGEVMKFVAVAEALDRGTIIEVNLEVTMRDGTVHPALWKKDQ
jgi:hypothetical protein